MSALKGSLKNTSQGSHKLPQAHEKCVMKKNSARVKMFLMEGGHL